MRSTRSLVVSLLVASAVVVAACGGAKSDNAASVNAKPQRAKPLAVGDIAPRYALVSLTGDSLVVGDSARSATLVNIWATWCESCREEFAELEHLRKEFGPSGFDVRAISVDQGSSEKVKKFVAAQGSTFAVAHDADAGIQRDYGVVGLPTSFLLDNTGKVRWAFTGDFRLDSAGLIAALHSTLGK